jgi:integrase
MAIYKREKTWWTDFSVNGQRFRESLGTTDWREAQQREKTLISQVETGKKSKPGRTFARQAFSVALEQYMQSRLPRLAPRTVQTERERSKALISFFGARSIQSIRTDDVLSYFAVRRSVGVANATITRERDLLRGVLVRAQRWHLLASDEIRPLKTNHEVGRAISPEAKTSLLEVARSKPAWEIALLAATLALNTTMRACEIKNIRWRDVDLMNRSVTVRRSKTEAGKRVIPLNSDALEAILRLRSRAKLLFNCEPEGNWFVFPHSEGLRNPDPTVPMSGWRTAWRNISRAIRCPGCGCIQHPAEKCSRSDCGADLREIKSRTAGLRFHDLRHQAITELAEGQASDQTIRSIAGHVSQKMLEHYSHVRLEAKREALEALSRRNKTFGYVTNHGTIRDEAPSELRNLLKNLVDETGIEPATSSLRTRRSPS